LVLVAGLCLAGLAFAQQQPVSSSVSFSVSLPDSIQIEITEQQRTETINRKIDSFKSVKECSSQLDFSLDEQKYCVQRYNSLHLEEE
jgi:hypothetical protein